MACAGSLPGYWAAVLTIDTLGRKPLQVVGFLVLTILFCVLGFAFHLLSETAMLALYVVAQFFFNWGPNTTTFIVPGECFPTRYRSTAHGMSAAMGKLGAILAQVISIPILSRDAPPNCTTSSKSCSPWLNRLMQIFALFMLCGTLVSIFCIPETKGITLEELAGEAPTSYNAGRNGSIGGGGGGGGRSRRMPPGKPGDKWNPFAGGQPAGFVYPRIGGGSSRRHRRRRIFGRSSAPQQNTARGGRDNDAGSMRSPDLAAQGANSEGTYGGGNRRLAPNRASSGRQLLSRNGTASNPLASGADSVATSARSRNSAASTATTNTNTNANTNSNTEGGRRSNWASNIHPLHSAFRSRSRDFDEGDENTPYGSYSGGGLRNPPRTATAMSGMSAGGTGRMDDDEILSTAAAGLGTGMFPGWGAGWGRIDREHVDASNLEDIRLRDVGQLLK